MRMTSEDVLNRSWMLPRHIGPPGCPVYGTGSSAVDVVIAVLNRQGSDGSRRVEACLGEKCWVFTLLHQRWI